AVSGRHCTLTGTTRMCERPIGILVEALRQLGAKIDYLEKEGFPPLRFSGFFPENDQKTIQVPGHVSSQFISALLLVAPTLPQGLQLELVGQINSRPYIEMTLAQMQHFGVQAQWQENKISVPPQPYQPKTFEVESDWSAASYWYSFGALSDDAELLLPGLRQHSLQGDKIVAQLMEPLGVQSAFTPEGVLLKKINQPLPQHLHYDFRNCPDLAQTLLVLCAALKVKLQATGMESLRVKETDRIAALQTELPKIGAELREVKEGVFELFIEKEAEKCPVISTYKDHRMAMSFVPLALRQELLIEEPEVVQKSYPKFWEELREVGVVLEGNI
ncbi:MAG: 3-phosphoshikimate 1-carboxyvinyltransferase, partial [Hymenobacteraceae bacterium]|nr:3-phosphoshikimate 1-carboxyvinyltransferase [Hymenobacteraceae bacterium]MDX5398099.1 3-phosphoshikimate 1-carboxyvinyltransferase [Hymenobacteraceae bacterium]MDX5514171.1 3-phosphoshikimate 1-carboxyvinyltransferase [Hymenobacteraceae bacterium]